MQQPRYVRFGTQLCFTYFTFEIVDTANIFRGYRYFVQAG